MSYYTSFAHLVQFAIVGRTPKLSRKRFSAHREASAAEV